MSRLPLALAALLVASPVHADSRDTWDKVSTALVLGLGAGAELTTLRHGDAEGQMQFLKTMGTTLALTEALKSAIPEARPDGSGNDGFPSGHTSLAVAAATYVSLRYGQESPGLVPLAYGAAAVTALGRVEARKHIAGDVVAGALLGYISAKVFTTPGEGLELHPLADGIGMSFAWKF